MKAMKISLLGGLALRLRKLWPVVAILAFGVMANVGLRAAQKIATSYNITATLYNCCDASSNHFALESDGASGSAAYSPSSTLLSYLSGSSTYEWASDLTESGRAFLLSLTPVNGSPAGPFSGPLAFSGKLRSRCFDPSNNVYSWLAIQTFDANCAMRVDFTYNQTPYILVMSPIEAGTGTATVTCTNWNGSSCSAWTDVPTTGVPNATVAHLYSLGRGGKETLVGPFALTFSATLTHP